MNARRIIRAGLALTVAGALAGCQATVGVGYGYSDPFYWNHYYCCDRDVDIDVDVNRPDRPDRPNRPDRPDRPDRPPAAKPKPPIAKPPNVRPPTHKPSRPRPGGGGGRFR